MLTKTRRARALRVTVGALALAAGLLAPIAKAETGDPGGNIDNPTITEPPAGIRSHPLWDSWYDLRPFGYTEHEYFVSGRIDATDPKKEYTTRIIVTRPADPTKFNGTAILDWVNVTAQFENAVDTMEARQMLMREGFAYVHVSAQEAGICCSPLTPKAWDPVRYDSLKHPGDEFANDIFSQVAKAIRVPTTANGNLDPTSGLKVQRLIAVGQSQSCSKLATYVTTTQNTAHLIDGFLIHGCDKTKNTSRQTLQAKVLHLLSDNEADPTDPATNENYRLWEIAGTAHSDYFIGYQSEVGSTAHVFAEQPQKTKAEYDEVMRAAGNYGAEIHPMLATCVFAGSTMPMHYSASSAIYQLDRWLRGDGFVPSNGPRFKFRDDVVAGLKPLETDDDLNTRGGVRLPPIDVPVARYLSTACPLGGLTVPFTDAEIQARYPLFSTYYGAMKIHTDDAVRAGWVLRTDAIDLMNRVCAAQNRWSTPAVPCPTYQPPPSPWGNKG
jgi:hypothetical protein